MHITEVIFLISGNPLTLSDKKYISVVEIFLNSASELVWFLKSSPQDAVCKRVKIGIESRSQIDYIHLY